MIRVCIEVEVLLKIKLESRGLFEKPRKPHCCHLLQIGLQMGKAVDEFSVM